MNMWMTIECECVYVHDFYWNIVFCAYMDKKRRLEVALNTTMFKDEDSYNLLSVNELLIMYQQIKLIARM